MAWESRTVMGVARRYTRGAVVAGYLYVMGGRAGGGATLDDNEMHDPVANNWTAKADITTPRYSMSLAVDGTDIYAFGGYDSADVDSNEVFDTVGNSWSSKTVMPSARRGTGAGTISGKQYVAGGAEVGSYVDENEEYTPSPTNTWDSTIAVVAGGARGYGEGVEASGLLYLIGGQAPITDKNEAYDPVGDSWSTKAVMTTGRAMTAAAYFEGNIYVYGGETSGGAQDVLEIYDVTGNAWSTGTAITGGTRTLQPAGGVIGGFIYCCGGYDSVLATVDTVERLMVSLDVTITESFDLADSTVSLLWGYDFLDESFALADLSPQQYDDMLAEIVTQTEMLERSWDRAIADSFDLADVVSEIIGKVVADSFDKADSPIALLWGYDLIAETFDIIDVMTADIAGELIESLVLSDSTNWSWEKLLAESFDMAVLPILTWYYALLETVNLAGYVPAILDVNVINSETCDMPDVTLAGVGVMVAQEMMIWDMPTSAWGATVLDSFDWAEGLTVILGNFLEEVLELSESLAVKWEGVDTILDSLGVIDYPVVQKVFTDVLLESFANADAVLSIHRKLALIVEVLEVVGDLQVYGETTLSLAEALNFQDDVRVGWLQLVADTFAVSEPAIFNFILGLKASEVLNLTESVPVIGEFTETNAETLLLRDKVIGAWHKLIAETVDYPDSVVLNLALKLLEDILFTDSVPDIGEFTHQLAESVAATDVTSFAWEKLLEDTVLNTDTLAVMWFMTALVADTFAGTDTVDNLFRIQAVNAESLTLAESVVPQLTFFNLVADGVEFEITVIIDGEVWQAWALNTKQFHPSVYSNFAFNSFAKFEGKSYGAKSDGVYLLEGSDDAGTTIRAGLQLTQSNFGSQNKKRIRAAYFGLSGSAPVFKVETEEGTAKYYQVTNRKAQVGREVFGKDWTLTLTDFDDLEFIELIPVILTR